MSTKTVSTTVNELSTLLSSRIVIADGKATIDKEAYVSCLPDNITKEIIEGVNEYNSQFYPAVTHAFGEKVIEAMKKDKKLDQVTLVTPLCGSDKFELTMHRSRTFPNPNQKGDGQPITKFGTITPNLITQAARGSRGEMSVVRETLSEMAMKALAG